MESPLISVCIPVCNGGKYIAATIQCLLQQSYRNMEIVVVDDGSSDNTVPVLEGFQDTRLRYIELPRRGAAAARNEAFRRSKGDYVKFMDADDLLNYSFIETQVSRLRGHVDCLASAKWGRFYQDDPETFRLSPEKVWKDMDAEDWLIESLIDSGGNMMQPGLFLIPRNLLEKSGLWNEELSLIDDFEFMCRVITAAEKVLFCPDAVLKYRSGIGGSLSSKKEAQHMRSAFRSLELGLDHLLARTDSKRAKLAAANAFQRWAYQFFPDHIELFREAEKKIVELGGSTVKPEGGRKFQWLAKCLGWKTATRLLGAAG